MLNIEKYKKILIDTEVISITKLAVINDKPVECRECYCSECDFGGKKDCKPYLEEWLFSEYEEPEVDWSKVKVDTLIYVRDKTSAPWVQHILLNTKKERYAHGLVAVHHSHQKLKTITIHGNTQN